MAGTRIKSSVTETCRVCGVTKSLDEFDLGVRWSASRAGDVFMSTTCRQCYSERRRKQSREQRKRLRFEVLRAYGGKCECCGESTHEFLVVDHVGGGGRRHKMSLGITGGGEFYEWLSRNSYPVGYRVLCHNCNASRGQYGYCPHEVGSHAD